MSGEEPNFFLLAEFVYFYCKIKKRNRWGYARIITDVGWILKDYDFGVAFGTSYMKWEASLDLVEIKKIYDLIPNRHASMAFLLWAVSGIGRNNVCKLKTRDINIDTGILLESIKLPEFVVSELRKYIERNIQAGATEDSYLIGNQTPKGTRYDVSAIDRLSHGIYRRNIKRTKLETGINPMEHMKSMGQGKIYPRGSIVKFCSRPGGLPR